MVVLNRHVVTVERIVIAHCPLIFHIIMKSKNPCYHDLYIYIYYYHVQYGREIFCFASAIQNFVQSRWSTGRLISRHVR